MTHDGSVARDLLFEGAGSPFIIPATAIASIRIGRSPTPVPLAPAGVSGLTIEDGRLVTRAHGKLAEAGSANAICTVVMSSGDTVLGALTFEHTEGKSFDAETIELLEHAAALLGPLLEIKRRDDRWIITKVVESMRDLVIKLVGPRHYAAKLIGLLLAGLLVFLSMAEGDYRVSADAVLEGSDPEPSRLVPVDADRVRLVADGVARDCLSVVLPDAFAPAGHP